MPENRQELDRNLRYEMYPRSGGLFKPERNRRVNPPRPQSWGEHKKDGEPAVIDNNKTIKRIELTQ